MSKRSVYQTALLPLILILFLTTINCVKEHPPFDEYKVAGFTPIDSVRAGVLFASNDKLYALYSTIYSNQWSQIREYDISNPTQPVLLNTHEIEQIQASSIVETGDTLAFLNYYSNLLILNLNSKRVEWLSVPSIYDLEYRSGLLFMSCYEGLVVWDISDLPNYIEVFNESADHAAGFVAMEDTVLLEIYQDPDYMFKFWNISNPLQPQIMAQGTMPLQLLYTNSIELTGNNVFSFRWNQDVRRFSYDSYDSLIYDDVLFREYSPHYALLDSLLYLHGYYTDFIYIVNATDFDSLHQLFVQGPYYERAIAMTACAERIYVLIRNQGIEIYERRVP